MAARCRSAFGHRRGDAHDKLDRARVKKQQVRRTLEAIAK
jgi:hypothetical protein